MIYWTYAFTVFIFPTFSPTFFMSVSATPKTKTTDTKDVFDDASCDALGMGEWCETQHFAQRGAENGCRAGPRGCEGCFFCWGRLVDGCLVVVVQQIFWLKTRKKGVVVCFFETGLRMDISDWDKLGPLFNLFAEVLCIILLQPSKGLLFVEEEFVLTFFPGW